MRALVRSNKDDAAEARASWVAAQHGDIPRVPKKSVEQQAVLALPEASRAALVLREYEGLSYAEIAQVVNSLAG